jgi:hypothetical protein
VVKLTGVAVFHDGGGRLAAGKDSDVVLRLGEEEREIKHRPKWVESKRGTVLTERGRTVARRFQSQRRWWRSSGEGRRGSTLGSSRKVKHAGDEGKTQEEAMEGKLASFTVGNG